MTTPPTVADLIGAALAADARDKAWVADRAGIPRTTFDRKMTLGGDTFTIRELAAIARVLGRDLSDLIGPRAA